MRCLLDKVTARYIVQGLLKLAEKRAVSREELAALDLFSLAHPQGIQFFIVPQTARVLARLARLPHLTAIIQFFLDRVEVFMPTRYFKRWARRLRGYGFTKEDAAVLALATFGTNETGGILGVAFVATFDQPMITQWGIQQPAIRGRLEAMLADISAPYNQAKLPRVLRPEQIKA
jgi:hypothetical protein